MGLVVVEREPSPWRDRLVRYQVLIDDVVVGDLRDGERIGFEVNDGMHQVQLRLRSAKSYRSPELVVEARAGSTAMVVCWAGPTIEPGPPKQIGWIRAEVKDQIGTASSRWVGDRVRPSPARGPLALRLAGLAVLLALLVGQVVAAAVGTSQGVHLVLSVATGGLFLTALALMVSTRARRRRRSMKRATTHWPPHSESGDGR